MIYSADCNSTGPDCETAPCWEAGLSETRSFQAREYSELLGSRCDGHHKRRFLFADGGHPTCWPEPVLAAQRLNRASRRSLGVGDPRHENHRISRRGCLASPQVRPRTSIAPPNRANRGPYPMVFFKMKCPAMPDAVIAGLPANSLSKGDGEERREIRQRLYLRVVTGSSGIQKIEVYRHDRWTLIWRWPMPPSHPSTTAAKTFSAKRRGSVTRSLATALTWGHARSRLAPPSYTTMT
jgi:hypothetical protein